MSMPRGIMAHYEPVTFKKDGVAVFIGQASLGCVLGEFVEDNHKMIRQCYEQLFNAVHEKRVFETALDYTSVEVRGVEYAKADLQRAGALPSNRGINPPKGPKR